MAEIITGLTFYLFAAVTIASAVMVVGSRNAVHSVLFLILAFFTCSALFVLRGAEFVAIQDHTLTQRFIGGWSGIY